MRIIALFVLLMPACLPLSNASTSTGIFFLLALWYAGAFLLISLSILEQNNVK